MLSSPVGQVDKGPCLLFFSPGHWYVEMFSNFQNHSTDKRGRGDTWFPGDRDPCTTEISRSFLEPWYKNPLYSLSQIFIPHGFSGRNASDRAGPNLKHFPLNLSISAPKYDSFLQGWSVRSLEYKCVVFLHHYLHTVSCLLVSSSHQVRPVPACPPRCLRLQVILKQLLQDGCAKNKLPFAWPTLDKPSMWIDRKSGLVLGWYNELFLCHHF
jgi:hypothetical protein